MLHRRNIIFRIYSQKQKKLLEFGVNITYEVPTQGLIISSVFKEIEANKKNNGLADWSLSQTTLEDVFLTIINMDDIDGSTDMKEIVSVQNFQGQIQIAEPKDKSKIID